MGNQKNSSVITLKHFFQPLDGFDIQMVCGLIQDQKIRLVLKYLFQSFSGFLTSGKCIEIIYAGFDVGMLLSEITYLFVF